MNREQAAREYAERKLYTFGEKHRLGDCTFLDVIAWSHESGHDSRQSEVDELVEALGKMTRDMSVIRNRFMSKEDNYPIIMDMGNRISDAAKTLTKYKPNNTDSNGTT